MVVLDPGLVSIRQACVTSGFGFDNEFGGGSLPRGFVWAPEAHSGVQRTQRIACHERQV
jgi:hypothetical protein